MFDPIVEEHEQCWTDAHKLLFEHPPELPSQRGDQFQGSVS